MTDPDERIINHAICLLEDEYQQEREQARAALHRLFRDRRRLEKALERIGRYEPGSKHIGEHAVALKQVARDALREKS